MVPTSCKARFLACNCQLAVRSSAPTRAAAAAAAAGQRTEKLVLSKVSVWILLESERETLDRGEGGGGGGSTHNQALIKVVPYYLVGDPLNNP